MKSTHFSDNALIFGSEGVKFVLSSVPFFLNSMILCYWIYKNPN